MGKRKFCGKNCFLKSLEVGQNVKNRVEAAHNSSGVLLLFPVCSLL